jgi:lysozyme
MDNTVLGIDVSHYQGVLDFTQVAGAGIQFCVTKATHGSVSLDSTFSRNWAAMKGVIRRGAYCWLVPEQDPIKQADFFADAVSLETADMPPTIDFEQATKLSPADLLTRLTACVKQVRARTGRKPMLYTGKWYWAQFCADVDSAELVELCDLWHAEYPSTKRVGTAYDEALKALGSPHPPKPWASRNLSPKLWQFDGDKGLVLPNGVDADFDRFVGTLGDFDAWIAASILPAGDQSNACVVPPDQRPDNG